MTTETHSQIASFIWSICNLLRGPYKRNEYRKVILPLTVLRRFDCILAPTKAEALKEHAAKTKVGYEIPLNRHFYRYEPPRPLEVIETDIKRLEDDILKML